MEATPGRYRKLAVTGIGAAVVDYIGVVDKHPDADSQVEMQIFSKQCGGNVATALATLARLGVNTSYLGKLGDDELAKLVETELSKHGIDLSGCVVEPGGSMGFAFVIVESGSGRRTILWTGEGKAHLSAEELNQDIILSSQYLHLDHYSIDVQIAAAKIAKAGNVQVVLDAESLQPGIEDLLPLVDILIVCADFAREFTQLDNYHQALELLYEQNHAHTVVITDGELGSYCRDPQQRHRQAAFAVEPVDTTGCGDVYHGGFIYGLLQGWPLTRTAQFASAAAALNCRALGGQAGLPSLFEVESFLKDAISLPVDSAGAGSTGAE